LGHLEFPYLREPQHGVLWLLRAYLHLALNGPAAVIVFFVISGFCIHFPNRDGLAMPSWKAYYARRYIRILIPMTVSLILAMPLRFPFNLFNHSILWSLLCEEIYYLLYPAFLMAQRRLGWRGLLIVSGVLSLCVILTNPGAREYPAYGSWLNWLLGLPCWLLGCHLAARFDVIRQRNVSTVQVWQWRMGAYVLSTIAEALAFHSPIGAPWSLNLFAIYGALWLEREMAYYRDRPAPPLEQAGEASYSIYLVHEHGFALATMMGVLALGAAPAYGILIISAGGFATLFYVLVERPSHKLARKVGHRKAAAVSPVKVASVGA
jgi:peptidoglycan/LPS O-acetylase OafA/YrhL